MLLKWVVLFIVTEAVISVIQFLLRKKQYKNRTRIIIFIIKGLVAIAFAVTALAGPVFLRPLQPLMISSYAVLLMDSLADGVYSIICMAAKKERKFSIAKISGVLLGVLFFIYGTVNMQTVLPNYHTYTSEKLTSEHKLIFVSDTHCGSAQEFSVLKKEVSEIAALEPDCIILGGDITDDYTTKEDMEETFRIFGSAGVPVYYVYGNHDRQKHAEYAHGLQYTPEELRQTIEDAGITILKDEYASLGPDLLLLGREDISETGSRADISSLTNPSPEKYLVVADHQPFEFKENMAAGTDLQLSGHTHAGQLFPLKPLYSLIGYAYGDFREGSATMNVSAGACGWRVPFRTESHCYYEVVSLVPGNADS